MNDWRETLRQRGYRLTPQRELILQAVESLGHATPEEVIAQVQLSSSAINASTVYRTLEVLEQLGLIRHAHLTDRAPTYHSVNGHAHFHLVCRVCGKVISVEPAHAEEFVRMLRGEHGFEADLGHLTVHGHCVSCADAPTDAPANDPTSDRTNVRTIDPTRDRADDRPESVGGHHPTNAEDPR